MRILGFCWKWDKLKEPEFTTFRFARKDKDWQEGETVQIVFKPRSKNREVLGIAQILAKESKGMSRGTPSVFPEISNEEAKHDGFVDYFQMWEWLFDTYGGRRLIDESMNKLTLQWKEANDTLRITHSFTADEYWFSDHELQTP